MATSIAQPRPRRRRWGRLFLISLLALVVTVAGLYLTVTSQWFLRGMLRRAARDSLGVELTVSHVALRLSGHLTLEGLELVGPEPEGDRIEAESVEIGFSPRSLLSGSPHLRRLAIRGGDASLTRRGDGTLALLADAPPSEPDEGGETPAVRLDALDLSDLTLHLRDHANALGEVLEADLTLGTLAAESIDPREGAENIGIDLRIDRIAQGDHTEITAGHLRGSGDLAIRSRGGLAIAAAFESRGFEGQWRGTPVNDVAIALEADTQTDAEGLAQIDAALDLTRRGSTAGRFALSGTCDTRSWDSDLLITLSDVTDQALEILWAQPGGADWGDSRAEGSVALTIRGGGDQISAEGDLQVRDLSVLAPAIAAERTPPLDLVLQSAVRADLTAERLHVDSLTTLGDLEGRRLLDAELDRPITLSWGELQEEIPPAGVTFALSDLDLGRIRPLLPSGLARQVRAGHLSAEGSLEVEGGQVVTAEGRLEARGLVLSPGEEILPALDLDSEGRVIADVGTRHLAITRSVTQVTGSGGETGVLDLSGDMDFQTHEGTLQTRAEGFDVPLLALLIGDTMGPRLTSGSVDTDTVITLSEGGEEMHLAGRAAWRNLSGLLDGTEPLSVPGGVSEFEIALGDAGVNIASLHVDLRDHGSLDAQGQIAWEGPSDLEVTTQGLDLAPLEDLVDEHLRLQIAAGQMTGSTHLSGAGGAWSVAFDGLLRLDTWRVPAWDNPMPPLTSRGIAMLALDADGRLTADPLRLALSLGDGSPTQVDGHLSLSTVDLSSPIRYEGELRDLNLANLRAHLPLEGTAIPSAGLIDWRGALSLHLREDATEIQANGHADGRGLRLDVPDLREALTEPLDVSLDVTGSARVGEQIMVEAERCEATLSRGGAGMGQISIRGTADPMNRVADLEVVIDSLDLEAIAGLMPAALAERFGEGEMRYRGHVQSAESGEAITSQGDLTVSGVDLSLMAEHHVTWTGSLLEITDTGITTRIGSAPPQTIALTASIDPSGTALSTFNVMGESVDLTELLADLGQGDVITVQTGPTRPWSLALPDLPDPGPLRLRGDLLLDRLTWDTLEILEPQVGITWERLSPGEPGCELSLSSLDAQVVGPRHTGRLQGNALLMQEGAGAPVTHSVNMTLTETDFDNLLPTLAPGLVDRVRGSMAVRRCQLSGEGRVWPRDFRDMQGVIEIDLADGEITRIPLLRAIIAATGLTTLERLQFFAGGLTLRPEGDHLALRAQQPFWVRGDLSLVTAEGSVFYDGRQDLRIAIGVHESFPHLGSLMSEAARGLAFPRNATYPEYRMFPLPIDSEGHWSDPRVHLGVPRVDQLLPGLIEQLVIEELWD